MTRSRVGPGGRVARPPWTSRAVALLSSLGLPGLLAPACHPVPASGARGTQISAPRAGVARDGGATSPEDHGDPVMEALAAEYLRFHPDLWPSATREVGRRDRVHLPATFPTRGRAPRPAKIRAYAWAGAGGCQTRSLLGAPFESDGASCSGVVDSTDLAPDEMKTVMDLVDDMDERMRLGASFAVIRCDFDPHHALVYLDASDTPIAIVEPCFTCHQWRIRPARRPDIMDDWEPPLMTQEQRDALARIFDAHRLGAWTMDEDDEKHTRVIDYLVRVYGGVSMFYAAQKGTLTERGRRLQAALVAAPPDVNRDISPKRATAAERGKLCEWYRTQFAANGERFASSGFECAGGLSYSFSLDEGECEKRAAACDRPVREIEACLRAFSRGPEEICKSGFPKACDGMRECAVAVRFGHEPAASSGGR